jgi:hypothetical protein
MKGKDMKKGIVLTIFLLLGLFLGSVLGEIAANVPSLSFLTWGKSIGIDPAATLDLSVFTLTIGMTLKMNLATVLSLVLSLFLYAKIGRNL